MNTRRTPPEAFQTERVSVRVVRVSELLDCDVTHVYRLIDAGELEAHGIGERGIRVYLDSVAALRERRQIIPKRAKSKKQKSATEPSAASKAQLTAMANLRRAGLL